jgi:uncharacterized protein (DUF433 family)
VSVVALGVESHPDICGGEPCIARTRIPVWALVQSQRLWLNNAEILKCFPTLQEEDLVNAWRYAYSHSDEINRQILENETAWDIADSIRQNLADSGRQFSDSVELLREDRDR